MIDRDFFFFLCPWLSPTQAVLLILMMSVFVYIICIHFTGFFFNMTVQILFCCGMHVAAGGWLPVAVIRYIQAFNPWLRLSCGPRAGPHQEGGVCRRWANFFFLFFTAVKKRKKKTKPINMRGTITHHMTGKITHSLLNVLLLSKWLLWKCLLAFCSRLFPPAA